MPFLENMIKYLTSLSKIEKVFFFTYLLSSLLLFLYSFTQIDLGLVISRFPILYTVEQAFQYIGYFNRPLSTTFFIILVALFSGLYYTIVRNSNSLSHKALWIIILGVSAILFLSYNAFSYDIFNYIFDAKIVTHYHANPYLNKALDYPAEPMLSFMHWTHRVYPYGPVWLLVTIPISFAGLQFFLPTFYLFKLLMLVSYLLTAYVMGRIVRIIAPESERFAVALFALNPLVIFETLVSGHNDMFMMLLMVSSLLFLLQRKRSLSLLFFLLSIGTKFATAFLLPIYGMLYLQRKKLDEAYWNVLMRWGVGLMFFAVLVASYRSNFQPWYLLFCLPFVALITDTKKILYPTLFISVVALSNYIPYLYTGSWTDAIMQQLFWINSLAGIISVLWVSLMYKTRTK